MRITSGLYRGRVLKAPDGGTVVRPTADKVRQAVFNILYGMGYPQDASVLDVFCGTGAMGLEALSRGAAFCTFIDKAKESLRCCGDNVKALGAADRSLILNGDATNPGSAPAGVRPASLFFLDPPYRQALVPGTLQALSVNGWLVPEALGVLEVEKEASDAIPTGFDLHDTRNYGSTRLLLVRYNPNS